MVLVHLCIHYHWLSMIMQVFKIKMPMNFILLQYKVSKLKQLNLRLWKQKPRKRYMVKCLILTDSFTKDQRKACRGESQTIQAAAGIRFPL